MNKTVIDEAKIKTISTLCLLSAPAFALACNVFQWTIPVAEIVGAIPGLTSLPERPFDIEEQYQELSRKALENTKRLVSTHSEKKILDELLAYNVFPADLEAVIKKTEAYREQYCTNQDAQKIVGIFERQFKNLLPEYQELSNMFILCYDSMTLENVKVLSEDAKRIENKINKIQPDVAETKEAALSIRNRLERITVDVVFIVITIGLFLTVSLLLPLRINLEMLALASSALVFAELLYTFFLGSIQNVRTDFRKRNNESQPYIFSRWRIRDVFILRAIRYSAVSAFLAFSIFVVAGFATDNTDSIILRAFILLLCDFVGLGGKYRYLTNPQIEKRKSQDDSTKDE